MPVSRPCLVGKVAEVHGGKYWSRANYNSPCAKATATKYTKQGHFKDKTNFGRGAEGNSLPQAVESGNENSGWFLQSSDQRSRSEKENPHEPIGRIIGRSLSLPGLVITRASILPPIAPPARKTFSPACHFPSSNRA